MVFMMKLSSPSSLLRSCPATLSLFWILQWRGFSHQPLSASLWTPWKGPQPTPLYIEHGTTDSILCMFLSLILILGFLLYLFPKYYKKKIETDCPINKWKLTDPELNILSKIDWSVGYCTNMYILLQTLLSQMCVHTHTDTCTYFKDGNNLDKGEVLALEVKVKRTDIWKIPTVYQHYKWHAILESSWLH